MPQRETWYVYILRCSDDSLYTGIAKDVERRVDAHNRGRGAAYTRPRRPVSVLYVEKKNSRVAALLREVRIKRLPRVAKQELILSGPPTRTRSPKVDNPWKIIFARSHRRRRAA